MLKSWNSQIFLVAGTALTTLIITPELGMDPVSLPKLVILSTTAFSAFAMALFSKSRHQFTTRKLEIILILALAIWPLISIFSSSEPLVQQFYGVWGRNTGYLTYLSFLFIFFAGTQLFLSEQKKYVINALSITGSISILYGLIQSLGFDLINWASNSGPIIGFLGNPNFQSTFAGLTIVSYTYTITNNANSSSIRISATLLALIGLYTIYRSNSEQGFFVSAIGISLYFFLTCIPNKKKATIWLSSVIYLFSLVIAGFGVLGLGPLGNYLSSSTIEIRKGYWSIAYKIVEQNPFLGVGVDGYGDLFTRVREAEDIAKIGSHTTTTAPHNVFLDFAVNGGVPYLAFYLFLIGYIFKRAINALQVNNFSDNRFNLIVSIWVAFLAQSVISINQIGLGIWNWLFMGTILGYSHSLSNSSSDVRLKRNETSARQPRVSIMLGAAGAIIGLVISLPPLLTDAKFRNSYSSGSPEVFEAASSSWPQDVVRMVTGVDVLRDNNFQELAIVLAKKTITFNPNSIYGYKALNSIPSLPESERAWAIRKLRELDPLGSKYL